MILVKSLPGHVWAYEHCSSATLVSKADDNVELDMDSMVKVLKENNNWENVITCPTVCPRKFNKVILTVNISSFGL